MVRLCTAVRTAVGQPYKLGLPWEGSGVSSYAVAFEAAREGLEADMDADTAPLCGHAAALKAHLGQAEAEAQQWLEAQGGLTADKPGEAIAYLRPHAGELEKDIPEASDEAAAELAQAPVYVEAALEAGMNGAKAAYGETSAAIGEGWQELTATIGKLFGWDGGPLPLRQTVPTAAKAGGSPVSALCDMQRGSPALAGGRKAGLAMQICTPAAMPAPFAPCKARVCKAAPRPCRGLCKHTLPGKQVRQACAYPSAAQGIQKQGHAAAHVPCGGMACLPPHCLQRGALWYKSSLRAAKFQASTASVAMTLETMKYSPTHSVIACTRPIVKSSPTAPMSA